MSDDRDPLSGVVVAGRFQIERRIGSGGMGNIYRALQIDMKRPVAIKMLHPEISDDPEVKGRFERELRATTRIEHPNSIRVYEYGEHEGRLFLAMELVDGEPLENAIQASAPFAPDRTCFIGGQIAQALAAAHAEKIVHRDLKPENVMLVKKYDQPDVVKVLDFGLARLTGEEEESGDHAVLTQMGVRVGTPNYMAPEYIGFFQFDHRSDLYALGVILYEMCTGQAPFMGRPYEVLEKAVNEKPTPPARLKPNTSPPFLSDLVMRLLEKDPNKRPQSAMEVYHTLDRGRAGLISQPNENVDAVAAELRRAKTPEVAAPHVTSGAAGTSAALAKARAGRTLTPPPDGAPTLVPDAALPTLELLRPNADVATAKSPNRVKKPATAAHPVHRATTIPLDEPAKGFPKWPFAIVGCVAIVLVMIALGFVATVLLADLLAAGMPRG